jgi:hypothetical protein
LTRATPLLLGAAAGLLGLAALASGAEPSRPSIRDAYAAVAGRILGAELVEGQAYAILQHLTDHVGPRLTASPGAEAAVRWTRERLGAYGLAARAEPVRVPRWVRGEEAAEIVAPAPHRLVVTALGGSEPTPEAGITAKVVEVRSFEELRALGIDEVRGRIVLYNRPISVGGPDNYGRVAVLRHRGAVEAARLGAVASLLRSLGTSSMRIPHTGAMGYEDGVPRIPAAAVAAEDADLIHRLLAGGHEVTVRLRLGCRNHPDVTSANVVADLPGRERPEEIVLIGAHLDSWDLGTGAIDDGAGVAMVMESLRLIQALGLRPRRTIRGVLFMNEESGLRGGLGYAEAHREELGRHVAAIESDFGADRLLGFNVEAGPGGVETVGEIASLLARLGADQVTAGPFGGADIGPLRPAGVPLITLRQDGTRYFDWHHSAADTLDKVDPGLLAQNAAGMAVLAYVLADQPEALPRLAPEGTGAR